MRSNHIMCVLYYIVMYCRCTGSRLSQIAVVDMELSEDRDISVSLRCE